MTIQTTIKVVYIDAFVSVYEVHHNIGNLLTVLMVANGYQLSSPLIVALPPEIVL